MTRRRRVVRTVTAFVPTRRLVIAIALLAPLWLLSWWRIGQVLAALASIALAVLVAVDIALLPDTRDLDVEREAPVTLGVGDMADGRHVVRSHWGRPLQVALFDTLPTTHVVVLNGERALALSPRGSGELAFTLEGRTRGEAPLGDLALRVRTPIGLVARTLHHRLDDRIVV